MEVHAEFKQALAAVNKRLRMEGQETKSKKTLCKSYLQRVKKKWWCPGLESNQHILANGRF